MTLNLDVLIYKMMLTNIQMKIENHSTTKLQTIWEKVELTISGEFLT